MIPTSSSSFFHTLLQLIFFLTLLIYGSSGRGDYFIFKRIFCFKVWNFLIDIPDSKYIIHTNICLFVCITKKNVNVLIFYSKHVYTLWFRKYASIRNNNKKENIKQILNILNKFVIPKSTILGKNQHCTRKQG